MNKVASYSESVVFLIEEAGLFRNWEETGLVWEECFTLMMEIEIEQE